jgi:hypothetical protein
MKQTGRAVTLSQLTPKEGALSSSTPKEKPQSLGVTDTPQANNSSFPSFLIGTIVLTVFIFMFWRSKNRKK